MPLVVVAVGWLIRHELARRAGIGEPLPATAEPVVTSGLTVLDVGEDAVTDLPQRPVLSREESREVPGVTLRRQDSALSYRLVTRRANIKRHRPSGP